MTDLDVAAEAESEDVAALPDPDEPVGLLGSGLTSQEAGALISAAFAEDCSTIVEEIFFSYFIFFSFEIF